MVKFIGIQEQMVISRNKNYILTLRQVSFEDRSHPIICFEWLPQSWLEQRPGNIFRVLRCVLSWWLCVCVSVCVCVCVCVVAVVVAGKCYNDGVSINNLWLRYNIIYFNTNLDELLDSKILQSSMETLEMRLSEEYSLTLQMLDKQSQKIT